MDGPFFYYPYKEKIMESMTPERYVELASLQEYLENPRGLYILDSPDLILEFCNVANISSLKQTIIVRYVNEKFAAILFYFAPKHGYLFPY
jgi:hypothetical protein